MTVTTYITRAVKAEGYDEITVAHENDSVVLRGGYYLTREMSAELAYELGKALIDCAREADGKLPALMPANFQFSA